MFHLAQSSTYKTAEFPSVELKNQYVKAEYSDHRCQRAYFLFQAAETPTERKKLAAETDTARFQFFTRWAKGHLSVPNFPPLRPVDDMA